jgi:putative flippase GtrA
VRGDVMANSASKESFPEQIRFLIVGGLNTFVGFGTFALFQFLSNGALHEVIVLLLAHTAASNSAFILQRKVVFRVSGRVLLDYIRFQSVYVVPLGINAIALPVLVRVGDVNVYLAQFLLTVVSALISYVGHKYFSFKRETESTH